MNYENLIYLMMMVQEQKIGIDFSFSFSSRLGQIFFKRTQTANRTHLCSCDKYE